MPEKRTVQRARKAARRGMSSSTQAGEFVHQEVRHVRRGKHGARSTKQAIAIGLSKARRAGVKAKPAKKAKASAATRRKAKRHNHAGQGVHARKMSSRRSMVRRSTSRRHSRRAASHRSMSRNARTANRHTSYRSTRSRSRSMRSSARSR